MIEVVIAVLLQFDTGSDISFAPLNSNLRNKRHGLDVIVFYKKKRLKIYILIYIILNTWSLQQLAEKLWSSV